MLRPRFLCLNAAERGRCSELAQGMGNDGNYNAVWLRFWKAIFKKGGHVTRSDRGSLLAALALCVTAATGFAQEKVQGRNWSGACTGCHGTEGRSVGAIPALAGIDKAKFVELMTAFQEGTQPATVMHQHAKGLSDEQIDALGDYFASRRPR